MESGKPDTVPAFLAAAKAALVDRGRVLPYRALELESASLARGLRERGVRAGDRVALWLPSIAAWLATFAACCRLGAIAVSLNTRFRSAEIEDIVSRSGCKALVYWPDFRGIDFRGILSACDPAALDGLGARIAYGEDYDELAKLPPLEDDASSPDAPCIVFTTSGTTKAPKFVLHDQKTLLRHARDVARDFRFVEDGTKVLVTAPLCGVFGFCNAMAAIAADKPLVMTPTFNASEAAGLVRSHGITHFNCTDEMIAQMLAAEPDDAALRSIRFVGYAAFNPALADLPARAAARGLTVVGLYGSSELQALLARQGEDAPPEERGLAGGKLVAAQGQVQARDPEGGARQPHGTPGELVFKAPSRMVGYFGDPAATRQATTADGWFRSGDLGYTLADDRFVFLTRLGDAMRLSGFLVSPGEIEETLLEHAQVHAAQVVAVETPGGPRPFAFVILRPGQTLDEAAILAHCAARMAKYKLPIGVQALTEFPVTPGANATKIQRGKLREMAREWVAGLQG
ncbi:MAG TPA: AMP-binding protein [Burkholderiales bacterium]